MLASDFLNHGGTIPKALPQSFLACPPSAQYIRQFMPQGMNYTTAVKTLPNRLESTAPANPISGGGVNNRGGTGGA